jgi:outer membrane protein assembly factor BamD (BamD/ComL family)
MYSVIIKAFIGLFFVLNVGVSFAQLGGSPENSALRNIEKHRWQKAELKLRKTLEKHPLNPGIRYVLSVLYFRAENPAFSLDSAYHYAVTALDDYASTPVKERDRLARMSVDSLGLIALRVKIDSTAFELARKANTEAAYLDFLSHFPSSVQRELAEKLRDEVAFQDAFQENTHHGFLSYLKRYPDAERAPEARRRYDRLLYESETKDQRLSSYEKFLADHPDTPYQDEIYRHIFEISTADGSVESFLTFIGRYPVSHLVKRARQMIFHILAEEDDPEWPAGILNDSLQKLLDVRETYLVPVLKSGLYGFIDETGEEILPSGFQSIDPEYLCGHITDELLRVDNQLINRSGTPVYHGEVDDLTDLGLGFLKIESDGVVRIVHKAGFILHDSVDDARILGKRYMAVNRNSFWRLYTLTGRLLDDSHWQGISALHDVIVFTNGEKEFIAPKDQLSKGADGVPMTLSEPFDEVKPWPHNLLWGRSGDFQGVLNQSLEGLIGFDKHVLTKSFFGATAALSNGVALYNWKGRRSSTFEKVAIFGNRVAVKKHRTWFLYDPVLHEIQSRPYDSLRGEGPFVLGLRRDTTVVHFADSHIAAFFRPRAVSFVPGRDSTFFLAVEENVRQKTVFDHRGRKLFSAWFDELEYAGQGVFVVTRNEKKGLLGMEGEKLLPAEFDAIGSARDEVLSILKNKKFGAYSIRHKRNIKPQYDRNLLPYNERLLIAFKDGYYGFCGWDNQPITAFEFDEIVYWHDSLALVRNGSRWSFYDIPSRRVAASNLRKITMVKYSDQEAVAIIQRDNDYGVISNKRKVVIPVTFSHIINLGSPDEPLYFTETHIEEAALFIVIYYDREGNMLRKEIYDDAADYDKIYCPDH